MSEYIEEAISEAELMLCPRGLPHTGMDNRAEHGHHTCWVIGELLNEIERLRAENEALRVASHEAMWDDTLIPIAEALGVGLDDEHGVPRRQFQMVEAIIKQARRG